MAPAFRATRSIGCSTRSSPPSRWGRDSGSGFPFPTASFRTSAAESMPTTGWRAERSSPSCFHGTRGNRSRPRVRSMAEHGPVVFVDDEASMREAVTQWLGLAGFETRVHDQASTALNTLTTDFPGVLVTDLKME